MRKTFLLMACLLTVAAIHADNYFTVCNDTLIVYPDSLSVYVNVPVRAHFDGKLDEWGLAFTYPTGMQGRSATPQQGMSIQYYNSSGIETTLLAPLGYNNDCTQISSVIREFGYWDHNHDGNYDPYGTVKWEPGDYDMFRVSCSFAVGFTGGTLTIAGTVKSLTDYRQGVIDPNPDTFVRSIAVIVGYYRGDVNGDGSLTIDDVTALINYLLNPDGAGWNQYQIAAADVDGNGSIGINDVTALTNLLIHSGTNNIEELLDILSAFNQMMYSRGQGVYSAPAGIDELTGMTRHAVDDNYYNLMGQPVGKDLPSTPGIYIHQGKKIVVR